MTAKYYYNLFNRTFPIYEIADLCWTIVSIDQRLYVIEYQ